MKKLCVALCVFIASVIIAAAAFAGEAYRVSIKDGKILTVQLLNQKDVKEVEVVFPDDFPRGADKDDFIQKLVVDGEKEVPYREMGVVKSFSLLTRKFVVQEPRDLVISYDRSKKQMMAVSGTEKSEFLVGRELNVYYWTFLLALVLGGICGAIAYLKRWDIPPGQTLIAGTCIATVTATIFAAIYDQNPGIPWLAFVFTGLGSVSAGIVMVGSVENALMSLIVACFSAAIGLVMLAKVSLSNGLVYSDAIFWPAILYFLIMLAAVIVFSLYQSRREPELKGVIRV